MTKLYICSFGCQMNVADLEEMSRPLIQKGFHLTNNADDAEVILINTCTVRQHAEDKAISFIGNLKAWKKENPQRILIVAGCAAERTKDSLQRRFPFIDLVAGAKSIENFTQLINEALKEKFSWINDNQGAWDSPDFNLPPATDNPTPGLSHPGLGYVTTMRGCNYSCAYCIVPSVRGRELYRSAIAIINDSKNHVKQGAKEIMLLGQTVNSYKNPVASCELRVASQNKNVTIQSVIPAPGLRQGQVAAEIQPHRNLDPRLRVDDEGRGQKPIEDFSDLLQAVANVPGVRRLRFMSPHPHYFSGKLIETMASAPVVCEHLHLPLQSGSDRILKSMRRNYTTKEYRSIIKNLRSAMPGISLTTDIVAGFPGETEDDFKASLDIVEELEFNFAYCFKFSLREGTEAAGMEEQISEEIIKKRHARLLEIVEKTGKQKARAMLGQKMEVLWETPMEGKSRNFYNVSLSRDQRAEPGSVSWVSIDAVKNRKLLGRLMS
ncbi:MAG: MiaB/RimO family radical SAM methylthiotransferase [Elusimicrobia bacterium]|nr:MiaB/RimO family radical SAM methylthiotransferase [Elusimicrobiota bacterium]